MKYDIIGDIHGHADELKSLLEKLGYRKDREGILFHPEHKAVFVGDFIDRGLQNKKVLSIVRPMIECGYALAVMGNHEYNAICYHTIKSNGDGGFLRKHDDKNTGQHQAFLNEFEDDPDGLKDVIEWFKTLPLFLELDGLRIVHAEWSVIEIYNLFKLDTGRYSKGIIDDNFIRSSVEKGSPEHNIIETLLKGSEMELPEGCSFSDKDGNPRTQVRVHWWSNSGEAFKDIELKPDDYNKAIKEMSFRPVYPSNTKPVFFGHYWMEQPVKLTADYAVCVDFSIAKSGVLCAYRWSSETKLSKDNLVWVPKSEEVSSMSRYTGGCHE